MEQRYRLPYYTAFLALAGFCLSLISLQHYVRLKYNLASDPSFCNINAAFNCDAVTMSAWGTVGGLPLASYGIGYYLFLLLFSILSIRAAIITREVSEDILLLSGWVTAILSILLFAI